MRRKMTSEERVVKPLVKRKKKPTKERRGAIQQSNLEGTGRNVSRREKN